MLSPLEFHWALEDYTAVDKKRFEYLRLLCEIIRELIVTVYNSSFGRKRADMIRDPKQILKFGWEGPTVQTVEEMKSIIFGLSHMKGVKITQQGKPIEFIPEK